MPSWQARSAQTQGEGARLRTEKAYGQARQYAVLAQCPSFDQNNLGIKEYHSFKRHQKESPWRFGLGTRTATHPHRMVDSSIQCFL